MLYVVPFLKHFKNHRNKVERRSAPVQLHDLILLGGTFFNTAQAVIDSMRTKSVGSTIKSGEFYPLFFDSNPGTLELLRLLVKEVRPNIVVETGVANGASTRNFLTAFKEFDLIDSKLFSLDIDPRVATPDLAASTQFNFILVDSPKSFSEAMKEIEVIDLFYHDSDHSYDNQMLEYATAWEMLNPDHGILVSDDINWSNAFLDFCIIVNRIPSLLSDGGKFSGVIYK
jgi:predicted O-methyltransferase YrrM